MQAARRWEPSELIAVAPETVTPLTALPEAVQLPGMDRPARGTAPLQADPAAWQTIAPGVEMWERRAYYDAKGRG